MNKDGKIIVYNVSDGRELLTWDETVYAISGKYIAIPEYLTNDQGVSIKIFNISDKTLFKSFIINGNFHSHVSYMTFNHKGDVLLVFAVGMYICVICNINPIGFKWRPSLPIGTVMN